MRPILFQRMSGRHRSDIRRCCQRAAQSTPRDVWGQSETKHQAMTSILSPYMIHPEVSGQLGTSSRGRRDTSCSASNGRLAACSRTLLPSQISTITPDRMELKTGTGIKYLMKPLVTIENPWPMSPRPSSWM